MAEWEALQGRDFQKSYLGLNWKDLGLNWNTLEFPTNVVHGSDKDKETKFYKTTDLQKKGSNGRMEWGVGGGRFVNQSP